MSSKVNLTKEGFDEISIIKSGMNSSREHLPLINHGVGASQPCFAEEEK